MLPDSVFDGSLQDHFVNILKAADPNVTAEKIFAYFDRIAALEMIINDEDLEKRIKVQIYENQEEIQNRREDFIIEVMADIASSHER